MKTPAKTSRIKKIVIAAVIVANILFFLGVRWHRQNLREKFEASIEQVHSDRPIYGGPAIEAHDQIAKRWAEELEKESPKEVLSKLTDAFEHWFSGVMIESDGTTESATESLRQETIYKYTIYYILGNCRFRKALEELQKMPKIEAANLLTQSIQENLAVMRAEYKEKLDMTEDYKKQQGHGIIYGVWDEGDWEYYRPRSSPKHPPTPMGHRYAIFSYLLLVAQLELREVRPAIEDVFRLAKEEFALFTSLEGDEYDSFRTTVVLVQSLYHPSLLLTGMLCDPSWNTELKKQLLEQNKLVTKEIVDYRARTTEYEMPGREEWVPVKPFKSMLTIRYYQGVSEEQLNASFP
ncbi:MAG: hypothetical protein LBJ00_09155 [Planctomycetaceae bacterium]|jgi:hypothetical protein|nr:hypothetical protein [Planctomycetaceae bacterium]